MALLPEVPVDERVDLETVGADPMHCEDMLDHTDCEDDCPCVPGADEPPMDRT